jgi:NUMOD3 motif
MCRFEKHWNVIGIEYGFIYRWTKKSNGKYYIGSHWGKFNDGYICSSNSMRRAYERNRSQFSRRILAVVTTNRLDLLDKEQAYLDKMPRRHFGAESYNISTKAHKPWWAKGQKLKKKIRAKISLSQNRPEVRAKKIAAQLGCKRTAETCARISAAKTGYKLSAKARASKAQANRRLEVRAKISAALTGYKHTAEARANMAASHIGTSSWNLGKKTPKKIREKISKALKGVNTWSAGRPLPKEHCEAISAALKGRKPSRNTLIAASKALKGKKLSSEHVRKLAASQRRRRCREGTTLSDKQVRYVQRVYSPKHPKFGCCMLAKKYGVSPTTIHGIVYGKFTYSKVA